MNIQSRSFVKQVQLDLIALSDADLLNVIQHWIDGNHFSEGTLAVPVETRLALGYTAAPPDVSLPAHQHADAPAAEGEGPVQWHAPSPQHLRDLLTAMDVPAFARHVIAFAYQALHPTHPEWYDGVTFNAHLANYLRRIRVDQARHDLKATRR